MATTNKAPTNATLKRQQRTLLQHLRAAQADVAALTRGQIELTTQLREAQAACHEWQARTEAAEPRAARAERQLARLQEVHEQAIASAPARPLAARLPGPLGWLARRLTAIAAGLLLAAAPAHATCSNAGQSCGATNVCCAGLACVGGGCKPVTTTTTPGATTTTSTLAWPRREAWDDLGLRYRDSQWITADSATGRKLNQTASWIRTATLHWVIEPAIMRIFRDVPSCADDLYAMSGVPQVDVSKFFAGYVRRPLDAGGPYFVSANYEWDLPHAMWLKRAHDCLLDDAAGNAARTDLSPVEFATVGLQAEHGTLTDLPPITVKLQPSTLYYPGKADDGLMTTKRPIAPLTDAQCALLHTAHEAHEANVAATLAHDEKAMATTGTKVLPTQLAFEASAVDWPQRTAFLLLFTGEIDPHATQARVDYFTRQASTFHARWHDAFHCDQPAESRESPDLALVERAALGHGRAHFLRAADPTAVGVNGTLAGIQLREFCDLYVFDCPQTVN